MKLVLESNHDDVKNAVKSDKRWGENIYSCNHGHERWQRKAQLNLVIIVMIMPSHSHDMDQGIVVTHIYAAGYQIYIRIEQYERT